MAKLADGACSETGGLGLSRTSGDAEWDSDGEEADAELAPELIGIEETKSSEVAGVEVELMELVVVVMMGEAAASGD